MKVLVVGLGQMGAGFGKPSGFYTEAVLKSGVKPEDVVGVDIDPVKVEAARKKFPGATFREELGEVSDVSAAIVATNTPSHHTLITGLMRQGITQIFCEKPLGISMSAVDDIRAVMEKTGGEVYTAFLMNFSPAVLHVIEKMKKENLILIEGSVTWGKNRYGDSRPTPGDLEDETVHGVGILHRIAGVNQKVHSIEVVGRLTYPRFASEEAQSKAHALDPSFPLQVNASTMAVEVITTDKTKVVSVLHSSFIGAEQVRRVTAVLARADDPAVPVCSASFTFDVKQDGNIVDQLILTTLDGNSVERFSFACDKLFEETKAFLIASMGGTVDPRLTDYNGAREAVAFTEAIKVSHEKGMVPVSAYTEADIVPARKTA